MALCIPPGGIPTGSTGLWLDAGGMPSVSRGPLAERFADCGLSDRGGIPGGGGVVGGIPVEREEKLAAVVAVATVAAEEAEETG